MVMEKIWLNNYPKGVVPEINLQGRTLVSQLDETCIKYATNNAVSCHGVTKNFAETHQYIENFAAALVKLGIKKGDRVAVIMPNIMQYPITIFAILKIGATVVNINPLFTTSEIQYLLENSGAKVAIVLNLMAGKLNSLYGTGALEHIIVTKVPDPYPLIKRLLINFVIKYIKRADINYSYPAHAYYDMINSSDKLSYRPEIIETDLAFIQYTGATTGRPKGAMLSHRNIMANLAQIHAWITPQIKGDLDKQVIIGALPLYHIFSLTANLFTFFFTGSENVMVPNPKDIKEIVNILNKVPFTIFSALDTLYAHLLNAPEFSAHKYPHFKYSVAGGMPARESIAKKWFNTTGVMPSNCYGLTETSPAVTMNPFDNKFDGSVGYPIPSTEIQVRDINTGDELPVCQTGVIYVRGPQLMSGYWNNPEQTKAAFDQNGWFNTKDLGYISEKGKLFLTGRQSEMIIVSGFNVYSAEVEAILDKVSQIKEAAVIGVPDSETGEVVIAYIVLHPGEQIDEIEIRQKCKNELAGYKVPRHVIIVDDLPKTLVGKIDKAALIKKHLKE
jgi:long-chain acyl-CoA synthetase